MYIQKQLICWILDPFCAIMSRFSQRTKNIIFYLGAALIMLDLFLAGSGHQGNRYIYSFILGCFASGLMILGTLPNRMRVIQIDKVLFSLWILTGLLMIWPTIRYNTDIMSELVLVLVIMPITWLVWNQTDVYGVLQKLCVVSRWSFYVFVLLSACLVPMTDYQYSGIFINVNGTAMQLTVVFCCLLMEVINENTKMALRIWDIVLIGICCSLIFYTNSRTGELAVICTFVGTVILLAINEKKRIFKLAEKVILPIVLSVAIFIPTTVYLFQGTNAVVESVLNLKKEESSEPDASYPENPVNPESSDSGGTITIPEQGEPDESHEENEPPAPHGIEGFIEKNKDKTELGTMDLNQYSTGRIAIWQEFSKHVLLFGRTPDTPYYVEGLNKYYDLAHNTFLDIALDSGLICACVFLLFCVLTGLKSIRYALQNRNHRFAYLPLAAALAFGITAMVASVNTPFSYAITMFYYYAQSPLLFQKEQ